jgi:NAD(P)-dependent dehydrogenase (short-subunit alcohol dehydrogenase family)
MKELKGEVALVTGGGRGFGRVIAKRFAAEGAAVSITARSKDELERVVAEIEGAGGRALAVPGDVRRAEEVARVVRESEARLGPLTLFVNNAGVPGPFGPIWEVNPDAWWAAQEVHIRAPILFLQHVLRGMTARKRGRVIVVSAIASRVVAPYLSAYCVGKLAQKRIVEEAAAETREHGVSVFAIDPGFVFTGIAEETMNSPDAQRWLPDMVARLKERKSEPEARLDLDRCAQRCVDLASGRYDGLSGHYMELPDDLDAMLRQAGKKAPAAH